MISEQETFYRPGDKIATAQELVVHALREGVRGLMRELPLSTRMQFKFSVDHLGEGDLRKVYDNLREKVMA